MPVAPSAYALTRYRRQLPELHKTLYDYVTLFDVYECAINPALLAQRIEDGEQRMSTHYILIELEAYCAHPHLDRFVWEADADTGRMKALHCDGLGA